MPAVLVDSNVILDLFTQDASWEAWSSGALATAASTHRLVINAVIFAEVSINFDAIEELEQELGSIFEREPIPFAAAFLAGKAFSNYRRRGGVRPSLLPDFLIGAHAAVQGYDLLTRDVTRYRKYYPTVRLIAP